jgi:hypothetical protein
MNGNGHDKKPKPKSRLDRIEAALELMIGDHEDFRQEHKQLLKAQVLLVDAQAKSEEKIAVLAAEQAKTEATMKELAKEQAKEQARTQREIRELSQRTDERIAAMTSALGELMRRWPLPPSPAV